MGLTLITHDRDGPSLDANLSGVRAFRAATTRAAQQDIVVLDAHAKPCPKTLDCVLQIRVVKSSQLAADLADDVMVVMSAGPRRFVTRLGTSHIQSLDQAVICKRLQGSVDARAPDRPAPAAEGRIDVMGAQGARLDGEQVDHLVAGASATVPRILKHGACMRAPTGVVDQHQTRVAGDDARSPRTSTRSAAART